MKTGVADLPLHPGKSPAWLFERMTRIARPLSQLIIDEYGTEEFLKRISNPYFFQSFGCVLGFDWHSSGLTTTMTASLKLALKPEDGVLVAGGKGKTSKKTPDDIKKIGEQFNLPEQKIAKLSYTSKITSKVDNSMIQDSYQLYHHSFFVDEKGRWAVVQQGLSQESKYARRYHWLYHPDLSFIQEPHSGIASEKFHQQVLDLTSKNSSEARKTSLDLIKDNPIHLKKYQKPIKNQTSLFNFSNLHLPERHRILKIDLGNFKAIESAHEFQPKSYEDMLMIKGMGAKTLRALALISNLVYGSPVSWKDPAKFSFAHGGKDGIPFPVNREIYDSNIEFLSNAVKEARLNNKDKLNALRRIKYLAE